MEQHNEGTRPGFHVVQPNAVDGCVPVSNTLSVHIP